MLAIFVLMAVGLCTSAAHAKIPAENIQVDINRISVKDDVYHLPANVPLYHGTSQPFLKFEPHTDAEKNVRVGTWFGADPETAAVQAYKYWCAGKGDAVKGPAVLVANHVALDLLLIPVGGGGGFEAHETAAAKIGVKSRNLNGLPATSATELLDEICKTKVYVKNNKIVGWSRDNHICRVGTGGKSGKDCVLFDRTQLGSPIGLHGWRAPWDQNEIAICHDLSKAPELTVARTVPLPKPQTAAASRGCAGTIYETDSVITPPQRTYDYVFKRAGAWTRVYEAFCPKKDLSVTLKMVNGRSFKAPLALPLPPAEFPDWVKKSVLQHRDWNDLRTVKSWKVLFNGKYVDENTCKALDNNSILYVAPEL
jgi:hypothetical protein